MLLIIFVLFISCVFLSFILSCIIFCELSCGSPERLQEIGVINVINELYHSIATIACHFPRITTSAAFSYVHFTVSWSVSLPCFSIESKSPGNSVQQPGSLFATVVALM